MVLLIHGRDVRLTFSTRRLSLAVLFVLLAAVFAFYWNLLPPSRHPGIGAGTDTVALYNLFTLSHLLLCVAQAVYV